MLYLKTIKIGIFILPCSDAGVPVPELEPWNWSRSGTGLELEQWNRQRPGTGSKEQKS